MASEAPKRKGVLRGVPIFVWMDDGFERYRLTVEMRELEDGSVWVREGAMVYGDTDSRRFVGETL